LNLGTKTSQSLVIENYEGIRSFGFYHGRLKIGKLGYVGAKSNYYKRGKTSNPGVLPIHQNFSGVGTPILDTVQRQ
jgi:hypothetical protein